MQWQTSLVSSDSQNALTPSGPLGYHFQRQNERISNTALGLKHSRPVSFLNDLDNPVPITAYKVLADGPLGILATAAARASNTPGVTTTWGSGNSSGFALLAGSPSGWK